MIPGFNLYKMATRLIGTSPYTFFAQASRGLDDRGVWVTSYAAGVELSDSIQSVSRGIYEKLGLDLDKYYLMIYTDNPLLVVERDTSGDQIEFQGERYQLLDNTDWRPQDGWSGVLAVRLNATVSP